MTEPKSDEQMTFIEGCKQLLEKSSMTKADISYVLATLWTVDQIPEIASEAEYKACKQLHDALNAKADEHLPPRSDPQWGKAFAAHVRSPEGMYLSAVGARLIEWEEKVDGAG
jgi:hypothetical protein